MIYVFEKSLMKYVFFGKCYIILCIAHYHFNQIKMNNNFKESLYSKLKYS